MQDTFVCGLMYGFFAAGIIGFILNQIRSASREMGASHRPLDTFPDSAQPNLTASKIYWKSFFASISCVIWVIILIIVGYLLYSLVSPMLIQIDHSFITLR